MVLVDKDIIQRNQEIFINGYNQKNVQSISYDIHVKEIITDDTNVEEYDLNPQQAIMVTVSCPDRRYSPSRYF